MSLFTGKDGYRFGDSMGAMLAKVETGVKNLGEKISGKAKAADAQAVQESNVLAATLSAAKDAHASGVKLRLSTAALDSIALLIQALDSAAKSGCYSKFEAEGHQQAANDSDLGLRCPPSPIDGGPSLASGCFQLASLQQQLFVHPEGGHASVGSKLVLHKNGPEARLCFRFVPDAASSADGAARASRSRSSSPTGHVSDYESPQTPSCAVSCESAARDAAHSPSTDAAASSTRIHGRLQHVDSGLFVAPAKATLPSPLILIADPPSRDFFAMTAAGHVLHVASSAVLCPAATTVSSGCALELRPQDSSLLARSVFTVRPFESYSNGHLILQSFFLAVCRKFRKYARTISSSTFVDPLCVKKLQHSSQVPSLAALCFKTNAVVVCESERLTHYFRSLPPFSSALSTCWSCSLITSRFCPPVQIRTELLPPPHGWLLPQSMACSITCLPCAPCNVLRVAMTLLFLRMLTWPASLTRPCTAPTSASCSPLARDFSSSSWCAIPNF
jgi:hypothetical protein